jgi:trigger factor
MPVEVSTTVTELDSSRVRVDAEVESEAVERELRRAAEALGRDLKIPGFRKGRVPAPVVLQRLGRAAVFEEAVRDALPEWYEDAVGDAGLSPVGRPKLDLNDMPERGSALSFSFEVGVVPSATLGEYRGLEVGRPTVEVSAEEVDAELERLRETQASLENVDRAAQTGDFVVLDFVGSVDGEPFEGGDARGQLLELGAGRLVPGFEEQLVGAAAEEAREVRVTFPEDYRAEHLAGREATFAVQVREVKEKRLPELDDDFAAEAGGFDSLEELRADVEVRLREARDQAVEQEYRGAVVDAVVAASKVEIPPELVHAKAHEMWHNTARRLQAQGIDPARYLEATGQTEEAVAGEAEPEAERALGRESVLAAVVEAEGIEVSDDELLEALRDSAAAHAQGHGHAPPDDDQLRASLERAREEGRDGDLRDDVRTRKAVDLLVAAATPIPVDQAEAREKLWTPASEEQAAPAEIWTPGS